MATTVANIGSWPSCWKIPDILNTTHVKEAIIPDSYIKICTKRQSRCMRSYIYRIALKRPSPAMWEQGPTPFIS